MPTLPPPSLTLTLGLPPQHQVAALVDGRRSARFGSELRLPFTNSAQYLQGARQSHLW